MEKLSFEFDSVPHYFESTSGTCKSLEDVVVFVRGQVKDPRKPVIIETDAAFSGDVLAPYNIYLSEEAAAKGVGLGGVSGRNCVMVLNFDDIENTDPDNIELQIKQYASKYEVPTFSVYIIGDEVDKIYDFMLAAQGHTVSAYSFVYPAALKRRLRLKPNGYDIHPASQDFDSQVRRNTASWPYLKNILDNLAKEIIENHKEPQNLALSRSHTVKVLSTYLYMVSGQTPADLWLYTFDQVSLKYMYPFGKLSMFERIEFLRKMPPVIGYSSDTTEELSLIKVFKKVYPTPVFVHMIEDDKLIEYSKLTQSMQALFHPESLAKVSESGADSPCRIVDSRMLFKGSSDYFTDDEQVKISLVGNEDAEVDAKWASTFAEIESKWIAHQQGNVTRGEMEAADMASAFMSFKNSYIVQIQAGGRTKHAVVYCKDTFGVLCTSHSEVCTYGVELLIPEEKFHRFVDAVIASQFLSKEYRSSVGQTGLMPASYSKELSTFSARLTPAVPPMVSVAMGLLPMLKNGLSYYDKILRCRPDVLPIVLDNNSVAYDKSPLFDVLPLDNLRRDMVASKSITSCGTIRGMGDTALMVSYEAFKGVMM